MRGKRGADHLAQAIREAGVERIFTLSGNQIMPVFDACLDAGIDLLHVRHEAAAVHMADAFGRLTGEPGVAMVTGGPGHANAISALYSARMSESPMVFLSGHAPHGQLGQGAFQEMAQARMAEPVCKAAWTVESAADMGSAMLEALAIARTGRPGPVHLSLPFDLINQSVDQPANLAPADVPALPDQSGMVAELRSLVADSARPLVVVGAHLMRVLGDRGVVELGDALGAPVVPSDSPRGIADPALGAFAEVLAQTDLLIALGRPVDFTLRMARPPFVAQDARVVLLNPEPQSIEASRKAVGDDARIALARQVDAVALAREIMADGAAPAASGGAAWIEEVRAAVAYRPAAWEDMTAAGEGALHALEVTRAVRAQYGDFDDTVLVMDGGEFGQWSQATLHAPVQTTNGPGGSIGSALPMAIAARVACPGHSVLALLGDGTFGFHMAEFDTAVRYGLDFVAIVGNDACWNAEYQIQLRDYGPDRLVGCELQPTRYDKVVEAMGGHGEHVTRAQDLETAIARARASGKPACVNVALERNAAPLVSRPAGGGPQVSPHA